MNVFILLSLSLFFGLNYRIWPHCFLEIVKLSGLRSTRILCNSYKKIMACCVLYFVFLPCYFFIPRTLVVLAANAPFVSHCSVPLCLLDFAYVES